MGHCEKSIVVSATPETCLQLWLDPNQVPSLISLVHSAEKRGDRLIWHWRLHGRHEEHLVWDAVAQAVGSRRLVMWHSLTSSPISNSGAIHFESIEGGKQTRMIVSCAFQVPPATAEYDISDLFEDPCPLVDQILATFPQVLAQKRGPGVRGGPKISK